jgi:hypothetical protein
MNHTAENLLRLVLRVIFANQPGTIVGFLFTTHLDDSVLYHLPCASWHTPMLDRLLGAIERKLILIFVRPAHDADPHCKGIKFQHF